MQFTVHTITRITPSARTGRERLRDADCEETFVVGGDGDTAEMPPRDTPLPVPREPAREQGRRDRPSVSGQLSAQLISQRLKSKSERRLAMFFPERINSAYRTAAALGRPTPFPHKRDA